MSRIASTIVAAVTMATLLTTPAHADTGGRNPDGTPCSDTDAACLLIENADLRARFNELAAGAFVLRQEFNAATARSRSFEVRAYDAEAAANQWRARFTYLHARFVRRGERIDRLRARVADLRDRLN